jgi:UDP-3-O-[3-hydroxymyristoyl] glucosamine N-acyltransferase
MPVKLGDLAGRVGGQLVGDPELLIKDARPLSDARQGEITLLDELPKCRQRPPIRASAVVAPRGFQPQGIAAILVDDTHAAFAGIIGVFRPRRVAARRGVSPLAIVSPSARLADDVEIHPLATIGDDVEIGYGATIHSGVHIMSGSKVGPGATLFPNVVLYEDTVVGAHCMIHSGTSLGTSLVTDGRREGPPCDRPAPGNVELADDVDVGAATVIDRGAGGPTMIGESTKIDNHVTIGHNAQIGPRNLLCSQVLMMSGIRSGRYVVAAGQAAVSSGVQVQDLAVLGGKASVNDGVPCRARVLGVPAIIERDFWVRELLLAKVPQMCDQLQSLQDAVRRATCASVGAPTI